MMLPVYLCSKEQEVDFLAERENTDYSIDYVDYATSKGISPDFYIDNKLLEDRGFHLFNCYNKYVRLDYFYRHKDVEEYRKELISLNIMQELKKEVLK